MAQSTIIAYHIMCTLPVWLFPLHPALPCGYSAVTLVPPACVNTCSTIFSRIIVLFIEALLNLIHSSESCCQSQWAIKASGHCSDDALPIQYSTAWMDSVLCKMRHLENALNRATIICFPLCMCLHVVTDSFPSTQAVRNSPFLILWKHNIWSANSCMQY